VIAPVTSNLPAPSVRHDEEIVPPPQPSLVMATGQRRWPRKAQAPHGCCCDSMIGFSEAVVLPVSPDEAFA